MAGLTGGLPTQPFPVLVMGENRYDPTPISVDLEANPLHIHSGSRFNQRGLVFMEWRIHENKSQGNDQNSDDAGSLQPTLEGRLPNVGKRVE